MSDQDPKRWLDPEAPAGSSLRELLAAGRDERPSAAQLQSLARRLGPPFDGSGPGGGGGGAVAPSGAPAAASSAVMLGLAAAALIALCAAWLLRGGETAASTNPQPAEPVSHATSRTPIADTGAPVPERPALAKPPAQPVVAADPDAKPKPMPVAPHAQPKPAAPTVIKPVAELELLERAHRLVRDAPAQALAAIAEHEQLYPESQFVQERELIAIEALIAEHMGELARARGERFLARYPGSSHARKVRALIAPAVPTAPPEGAAAKP